MQTKAQSRTKSPERAIAPRSLVEHRTRDTFRAGCPVHVTLRLAAGLPSLRKRATYTVLLVALGGGSERFGMRLVHWSVLGDHLHLLIEACDRRALSRGMQGLAVRLAKALNRWWRRAGRVFADRYHSHALRSPSEGRRALFYVLQNARKHGIVPDGADVAAEAGVAAVGAVRRRRWSGRTVSSRGSRLPLRRREARGCAR